MKLALWLKVKKGDDVAVKTQEIGSVTSLAVSGSMLSFTLDGKVYYYSLHNIVEFAIKEPT